MLTYDGVKRANNNERAVLTEEQSRKAQLLAAYELLDARGKQLLMAMAGTMARLRESH